MKTKSLFKKKLDANATHSSYLCTPRSQNPKLGFYLFYFSERMRPSYHLVLIGVSPIKILNYDGK